MKGLRNVGDKIMPSEKGKQFNISVAKDAPLTAAEIKAALSKLATDSGITSGYHVIPRPAIGLMLALLLDQKSDELTKLIESLDKGNSDD